MQSFHLVLAALGALLPFEYYLYISESFYNLFSAHFILHSLVSKPDYLEFAVLNLFYLPCVLVCLSIFISVT